MFHSIAIMHPIAYTNFRKNIFGFRRTDFQFSVNVCHIDTQNPIVSGSIRTPNMLDNLIIGQNLAGMLCQQCYNLIFILR